MIQNKKANINYLVFRVSKYSNKGKTGAKGQDVEVFDLMKCQDIIIELVTLMLLGRTT